VIDVKGIEGATRRDSVPIIARIMGEIMDLLFPLDKNNCGDGVITKEERKEIIENIKQVVRISVRKVLSGEVDVGEFIMTKVVRSNFSVDHRDYGWERMPEIIRGSRLISLSSIRPVRGILGVCLKMGSGMNRKISPSNRRVSYVLIQAPPNAKGFEKAEDPEYAIKQGLSLDWSYYLDHTIKNPLSRILEYLPPSHHIN
jgi:DNA polymerase delta subunit 1